MPTILAHAAVPIAIGLGLGRRKIPAGLVAAGIMLAMLPDLDIVGLVSGIPYHDQFGHRGASHSLIAALALALAGTLASRMLAVSAMRVFIFLFVSAASHGLLDAFTDGGLGVALLWPFADERIFAPVRPILVSPIGLSFFSPEGLRVLISEAQYVWAPCVLLAVLLRIAGREPDWAVHR